MPVYSLVEYSDSYEKTSGSLWQYYRNKPTSANDGVIKNFHVCDNNNALFKFKQKITCVTAAGGTKDVEIIVKNV